jgi:RND family efflux transporter MFP subunit
MFKKYALHIYAVVVLISCGANKNAPEDADHAHEEQVNVITQWTDDLELFAEIAPIFLGEQVDAIIHLTTLSDFKPVLTGSVNIHFQPHGGETKTFSAELARPGIFIGHIEINQAGLYDVEIKFTNEDFETSFYAGHLRVFADETKMEQFAHDSETFDHDDGDAHAHDEAEAELHDDHAHAEGEDHDFAAGSTNFITFLKEQQWKTDFATALVEERQIVSSVMAVSEIIPHQHGYADVVAPVDGLLLVEHNQHMAVPGTHVKKGDQLLVLCPPIGASNTWLDRQLEYDRAKREFERAEKLYSREAISQREYEQIKQNYTIEKSSYETLLQNFSAGQMEGSKSCLLLRSPIDGVVANVSVLPGQNISAGQQMLTVIDPSIVWIRSQVFEKDINRLGEPAGLTVRLQGSNELIQFEQNDFEILSKGIMLDVNTRTIPVVFEVKNPNNQLKIGQIVQTEIHTTQSRDMLAVPASAIIDEEIDKVVFVQVEGESFEKRSVQTGPTFGDWVAITSGLHHSERVVTKGAYAVKLASANVSVGSAHVH